MRQWQTQNGNVAQNARDGNAELREEQVDARARDPGHPEPFAGSALEGCCENAGDVPGGGQAAADVAAESDLAHGKDAEVEEEEGDFVEVDAGDVDDFGADEGLSYNTSR